MVRASCRPLMSIVWSSPQSLPSPSAWRSILWRGLSSCPHIPRKVPPLPLSRNHLHRNLALNARRENRPPKKPPQNPSPIVEPGVGQLVWEEERPSVV